MKMPRIKAVVAAGVILLIGGSALAILAYVREPRRTSALRGARVAEKLGCFACHGPRGTGGVPNPGSEEQEVPAWDGGTAMMYVKSEQEIREWILNGRPKRLEHDRRDTASDNPDARTTRDEQRDGPETLPLRMPAFKGILPGNQLNDLVAFYKAVAVFDTIPPDAHEGYRVASRLGCFGCHGPSGRIGSSNPRSFKGYIPPWQGADFSDLVKKDDELRQWILKGKIDRFDSNRLACFFTRRQLIRMPSYRNALSDEELEALITYVRWLQNQES